MQGSAASSFAAKNIEQGQISAKNPERLDDLLTGN